MVNKLTSASIGAFLAGVLAYSILHFGFYEIDTSHFANLIGLAAIIGAAIGGRIGRSRDHGGKE